MFFIELSVITTIDIHVDFTTVSMLFISFFDALSGHFSLHPSAAVRRFEFLKVASFYGSHSSFNISTEYRTGLEYRTYEYLHQCLFINICTCPIIYLIYGVYPNILTHILALVVIWVTKFSVRLFSPKKSAKPSHFNADLNLNIQITNYVRCIALEASFITAFIPVQDN